MNRVNLLGIVILFRLLEFRNEIVTEEEAESLNFARKIVHNIAESLGKPIFKTVIAACEYISKSLDFKTYVPTKNDLSVNSFATNRTFSKFGCFEVSTIMTNLHYFFADKFCVGNLVQPKFSDLFSLSDFYLVLADSDINFLPVVDIEWLLSSVENNNFNRYRLTISELQDADEYLLTHSYVDGYEPSPSDYLFFKTIKRQIDKLEFPNLYRWFAHIESFPLKFR